MGITRTQLLDRALGTIWIDRLEVQEIIMGPGEMGGLHLHPCPVTGYIKKGRAIMQVEGEEELQLREGAIFFEPQNSQILKFGNASSTEKLIFVAFYLVRGEQKLIEML